MSTVRTCLARLQQPRYGRLDMLLFLLIVTTGATAIAHQFIIKERRFWLEKMWGTPLPQVTLTESVDWPETPTDPNRYQFTEDWHSRHVAIWQAALSRFRNQPNVHYLEIGVFEGHSLIWMLDNILIHPTSRATAIDVFLDSYGERYFANIEESGHAERVVTITDWSQQALRKLPLHTYDIIYVDGSHVKSDVLEDAVLSWRLLKQGGILIFDDYRFVAKGQQVMCPKMAIDPFVQCFQDQCRVVHNGFQLIIEKTGERPEPALPPSQQ